MWGRLIIRRFSHFVIMNTTLEALTSYINLPIILDLCIAHIFTSPRDYGTIYLIVVRSLKVSLNVSKTMLKNLNLTIEVKRY